MTDRPTLSDALAASYEARDHERKPAKPETWAPGADPLEHVRRLAETVEASPGYAATLSNRDRTAVQTFLARKAHLKAQANDTTGDDQ